MEKIHKYENIFFLYCIKTVHIKKKTTCSWYKNLILSGLYDNYQLVSMVVFVL